MGAVGRIVGYVLATLFVVFLLAAAALSLPASGWRALSVQTGSMRPTINPGALVLVHRVPVSSLHIGDVITYNSKLIQGEMVTHRIIAFKQVGEVREIIVKGDANKVADPPLLPSQVAGRVVSSVPYAGRIIDALHKPPGLILIIYLPAFLIVIYEIRLLVTRLSELEVAKREQTRAAEQATSSVISAQVQPVGQRRPSRRVRRLDGLCLVVAAGALLLGIGFGRTYSQLKAVATLTGDSISASAPTTTPTPPTGGCTNSSSSTSVKVHTSTDQSTSTGSVSNSDTTTNGSVSSGSHTNTSSTNVNISITNC